jgi:outer membrane protein TolC
MPGSDRERLSEHYRKRFEYISRKYPDFEPASVGVHLGVLRTSDMLWRVLRKHLRGFDLTPPALGVMIMLDSNQGPMTMTEISRELVVTQANITGIIDTLEKREFVARCPDKEDRRVCRISITEKGLRTLGEIVPDYFELIHSLYKDLDPAESATLSGALEKIRARLIPLMGAVLLAAASMLPANASTWTVRESVEAALAIHPGVAEARRGVDASLAAQLRLLGAYDPSLAASVKRLDAKTPPTFIFQTARTVTDSGSASLSKHFAYGTTAGVSTFYSKEKDNVTSAFSFNPRHRTGLDLTLQQPLLKGLVGTPERAALRASERAAAAARATLARAAEGAAAEVGAAYWQLWRARKAIDVFRRSAEEAREFLATTRRLRKRYEAERDDLLRAEADLLAKELEVLDSGEAAVERAVELAEATGVDAASIAKADLESPPEPNGVADVSELVASALETRSDLVAAKAAAERDAENLAAAEAGFGLPELALNGSFGWAGLKTTSSDSYGQLGRFGFRTWSVGLDLNYAFGRRRDRAETRDASAAKMLADARTAALERRVRREVENALRRLRVSSERVRVARRLETMQEEVLKLSQKKYSQGRIASRDRLRDANAALGARSLRLAAEAEFASRRIQTFAAEGVLLDKLGIDPASYKGGRP